MKTLNEKVAELKSKGYIGKEIITAILNCIDYGEEEIVVNKGDYIEYQALARAIKIDFLRGLDRRENEAGGYIDIYLCKVEYKYLVDIHLLRVYRSGSSYNVVYRSRNNGKYTIIEKETARCGSTVNHLCKLISGTSYIYKDVRNMQVMEHIIVAIAYGMFDGLDIETIYNMVVNHKNNNREDNSLDNLELCTRSENSIHGSVINSHPDIKSLTAKEALEIYRSEN